MNGSSVAEIAWEKEFHDEREAKRELTNFQMYNTLREDINQNIIRLQITVSRKIEQENNGHRETLFVLLRNVFEMEISNSSHQLKGQKSCDVLGETSRRVGVGENVIQHVRFQTFGDQNDMLFEIENTFEFENS